MVADSRGGDRGRRLARKGDPGRPPPDPNGRLQRQSSTFSVFWNPPNTGNPPIGAKSSCIAPPARAYTGRIQPIMPPGRAATFSRLRGEVSELSLIGWPTARQPSAQLANRANEGQTNRKASIGPPSSRIRAWRAAAVCVIVSIPSREMFSFSTSWSSSLNRGKRMISSTRFANGHFYDLRFPRPLPQQATLLGRKPASWGCFAAGSR